MLFLEKIAINKNKTMIQHEKQIKKTNILHANNSNKIKSCKERLSTTNCLELIVLFLYVIKTLIPEKKEKIMNKNMENSVAQKAEVQNLKISNEAVTLAYLDIPKSSIDNKTENPLHHKPIIL